MRQFDRNMFLRTLMGISLTSGIAGAGPITYPGSVTYTAQTGTNPASGSGALWVYTLSFPKFQIQGATLTSIDFQLEATRNFFGTARNITSNTEDFHYFYTYQILAFTNDLFPGYHGTPKVLLGEQGHVTAGPGAFFSFGVSSRTETVQWSQGGFGPSLSPSYTFLQTGNVLVAGSITLEDAVGGAFLTPAEDVSGVNFRWTGSARLNVTYNFTTEVPEPAGTILVGCGLALLATLRRRS